MYLAPRWLCRMAAGQRRTSPFHLLVRLGLLALFILVGCDSGVLSRWPMAEAGEDIIQIYSIIPPILKSYWYNGMAFWSIGWSTVVTDSYVRLTEAVYGTRGYVWNRHGNRLNEFLLRVTVHLHTQDGRWFADGKDSGIVVWYTKERAVNISEANFFGFNSRFNGIGVVLDHSNTISVIENDGSTTFSPDMVASKRLGSCDVPTFGDLHLTLSLKHYGTNLEVWVTVHPGQEPMEGDHKMANLCTNQSSISLPGKYFFGITAANGPTSQAVHNVHSVVFSASTEQEAKKLEEEEGNHLNPHLFENGPAEFDRGDEAISRPTG